MLWNPRRLETECLGGSLRYGRHVMTTEGLGGKIVIGVHNVALVLRASRKRTNGCTQKRAAH